MARYRSRSRSYSPRRRSRTPPRGRKRYDDDPRDRYRESRSHRDRRSPAPSGLLVRNLPLDARYFMFFFELSMLLIMSRVIILMEELNASFAFMFLYILVHFCLESGILGRL